MSLFGKLFGSSEKKAEPVEHNGFRIFAEPMKEAGGFRIGARIEAEIDGVKKTQSMIRADTYQNAETAMEASVTKAKMLIDQVGSRIFD